MKNAPNRDTIILWSAVIAGIGLLALLIRHAAIYKFGTDTFTGNVLFGVSLILLVGLYLGFQSVIEDFSRTISNFFRKKESIVIAETTSGEQIAISENDIESTVMEFTETMEHDCDVATIDEISDCSTTTEERELTEADFSPEYLAYLDEQMDKELEEAYNDWLENQPEHIQEEIRTGINRVKVEPQYTTPVGCFAQTGSESQRTNEDGSITIEECTEDVYIAANGNVYWLDELEEALTAYETRKQQGDIPAHLLDQHRQCEIARKELEEEVRKEMLEKIGFICAYLIYMMEAHMDANELQKLLHNAKLWTSKPMPHFEPVDLNSPHLTKEDLKHLGYNVGKFIKMQGAEIARFVKKVFVKPFESTAVKTIEQKLRESKSTKERIPIHTADQMDKLFAHFQRYGNINLSILNKK